MRESEVSEYRKQAAALREKLQKKIKDEPEYVLKKMCLSGSLAKGTALRNINDIDVALYVKQDNPDDMPKFIAWLVKEMQALYPNMDPSQITPQEVSVKISYRGSGLDVDVVPITHQGDAVDNDNTDDSEWDGFLYSRSGQWIKTNIPRHITFMRQRTSQNPTHFRQVVRLIKHWIKLRKLENSQFKFKSFLAELILAHLADKRSIQLSDYVEAMAGFFNFVSRNGLDETIVFNDYYHPSDVGKSFAPIRVFDPTNSENNVASPYKKNDKNLIVDKCGEAADAIDAGIYAPTKEKAKYYWRKILGTSF